MNKPNTPESPTNAETKQLPSIQQEIQHALSLPLSERVTLAKAGSMSFECLVYLFRQASRSSESSDYQRKLYAVFEYRCRNKLMNRSLQYLQEPMRSKACQEIIDRMATSLFDLSPKSKLMEERFNLFFKRRIIDVCRLKKFQQEAQEIEFTDEAIIPAEQTPQAELFGMNTLEAQLFLRQAIKHILDEGKDIDLVKAFVMKHRDGMTQPQIAANLGITDRTVRNWNKKVEQMLADFRERQR